MRWTEQLGLISRWENDGRTSLRTSSKLICSGDKATVHGQSDSHKLTVGASLGLVDDSTVISAMLSRYAALVL